MLIVLSAIFKQGNLVLEFTQFLTVRAVVLTPGRPNQAILPCNQQTNHHPVGGRSDGRSGGIQSGNCCQNTSIKLGTTTRVCSFPLSAVGRTSSCRAMRRRHRSWVKSHMNNEWQTWCRHVLLLCYVCVPLKLHIACRRVPT